MEQNDGAFQTRSGDFSPRNNLRGRGGGRRGSGSPATPRTFGYRGGRSSGSPATSRPARQSLGLPSNEPDKKRTAAALQLGEISALKDNYGFMVPLMKADDEQEEKKSVYFRFDDTAKTETGLLNVEVGDVLQFTSNNDREKPRALYARLWQCKRSPLLLTLYLDKLLSMSHENAGKILRVITRCPVGFLLLLQMKRPPLHLVHSVLKLIEILHAEAPAFYDARMKQICKLFCGSEFLRSPNALKEYALSSFEHEEEEEEEDRLSLVKAFILRLAGQIPEIITDLLPIVEAMIESIKDDKKWSPYCAFLMEIIRGQANLSKLNSSCSNSGEQEQKPAWDKMPLVPLSSEVGSGSQLTSLPSVKKRGSYGSVEGYLDTYYQLLREDCFGPLRKGLADLKANKLDPRDMKVWVNGSVIGVHFGRRNPGITIAVKAERLLQGAIKGPAQLPMQGTLLCISDDVDGGKFDNPIWGVVAKCEEEKKNHPVIFVEIVDGKSGGLSAQCISRLIGSSSFNFAENPTFYKVYEPVLRALQQMDTENFPFKQEFVYTKWMNETPAYLSEPTTTVDWGCLFGESTVRSGVRDLANLIKGGYRTTLDQSQLNAVKLAVNNRLVLIQGPPGTGKSFVGAKILEILLSADTLPCAPVLVVTFKNQGLDNFLQSCLKFCPDGLVRVGGRSTEPSLEKFNLNSLLLEPDEFSTDCFDNDRKLEKAQSELEEALKQLRLSDGFCLESVVRYMPDLQLRKFFIPDLLPEDVSVADFLGQDSSDSKRLSQVLWKSLESWMSKKETFKAVAECFSGPNVSTLPKRVATDYGTDKGVTNVDEDEECNEQDNVLQEQFLEDKASETEDLDERGKGRKQNEAVWLNNNFFSCKPIAGEADRAAKAYSHIQRSKDIDVERYHWLLEEDPWDLSECQRAILLQLLMQAGHEKALRRLQDAKKAYDEICQDMEEINKRRKLQVLKNAKIVGMTTSGAALNQELLKALNPCIVFVEEAAEVLEPQLLAVVGPSVQHLILIGDHYQLSPSVEVYDLERRHGFSVSLFERLVEHNKMPFQALSSQSRMREEFVPMILPIYPNLRTNKQFISGERNRHPICMTNPMYFWSHSYKETKQRSCSNEGEAKMVVALVSWMLAEGQKPKEITVLGAYNGQVTLLRDMLKVKPELGAVQVLTIDRFQGSENKVIILSLVRSNDEGNIGHLIKRNRLCVAVSRARGAMYFCGNNNTFSQKSEHWRTLLQYLSDKNCVGDIVHFCCPRHSLSPPFEVSSKHIDHFNPLLCKRSCKTQLPCGHYCQTTCHFGDHPKCIEFVRFTFSICGHEATKRCSDEETKLCQQELMHTFDSCGHKKVVNCWKKIRKDLKCDEPCRNVLDCGHPCTSKCFENCKANPCSTCIEIERIKAQKEKQLEAQRLKMKLKEISEEIKRLNDTTDNQEILVTYLSPEGESAAEYCQIMDRTEKFIQPGHDVVLVVTEIQKVFNPKLLIEFLKAQRDLFQPTSPAHLLFHGTDDAGVAGITRDGFRLPKADARNMFGQGCYFATDSTKSAQRLYTKGSNKLLLCEVLLGRAWTVQEDHPEMDKDKIRKKGYDSLFSKRGGRGTGGTLYDEYVIYNPNQAIPRYIVHYKSQHDPQALKAHAFQNNLTRISYEPSLTFSGDNPGEYHFRQAESQFYRMSTRHDQKVVKVELILNKILEKRYESAMQELQKGKVKVQQRFVFHGTDKHAIESIIQDGFKIGGQGVSVRNGAAYGAGVYTAVDPDISIGYSKGSGMMLLSLALVGDQGTHYTEGGSRDVLVLKNADYLLPRYIVHLSNR